MIRLPEQLTRWWSSRSQGQRLVLIGIGAFIVLFALMNREINVYDEGLILYGADRVGSGDVPHRDFRCIYGPAQFYVLAGLYKLFSPSVLVLRLWDTLVRAASVVLLYLLVERSASPKAARVAALLGTVWLAAFGVYGYPVFPCLLFSLWSVWLLTPFFEGERAALARVCGAGACVGVTALFRYDVGFAVCAAESIVLVAYLIRKRCPAGGYLSSLGAFWGGTALVFVPVAAAYLLTSPVADFLRDIVYYPARYYSLMRSLPFPTPGTLSGGNVLIYFPVLVWPLALLALRRRPEGTWTVLLLVALSMIFFGKGVVRVSTVHMALSILPALGVLCMVWTPGAWRRRDALAVLGGLCVAVCVWATGDMARLRIKHLAHYLSGKGATEMWHAFRPAPAAAEQGAIPRSSGFAVAPKRAEAIRYVREHTGPGEGIFCGTSRHDKIMINDVVFYFLAERPAVTMWHQFDPGLQTTAATQSAMVAELEAKRPRYIVLESEWDNIREPNGSALSSGVHILDAYTAANYRDEARFEDVRVLRRVEASAGAAAAVGVSAWSGASPAGQR